MRAMSFGYWSCRAVYLVPLFLLVIFQLTGALENQNAEYPNRQDQQVTIPKINLNGTICDSCRCTQETTFITVICDFKQNNKLDRNFGSNYKLPPRTYQLIFLLDTSSSLTIENGLLAGSNVNRLTIEGPDNHGGTVEIRENAFKDNNGPFPDIKLVHVDKIIFHEKAFKGEFKLNVTESSEVIILKNTFRHTQLDGNFKNIRDLRISEGSFFNTSATLRFQRCNIANIHRFEVNLREVLFEGCKIGTINPGAFDVNMINSLIFRQCEIEVIKSKAVTEKLYGKELSITDGAIGRIESEAIHGSGISEIKLLNNTIENIGANAIEVTSVNTTILQNRLINLEDNWLFIKQWSNVRIAHNKFYDFGAIKLEQEARGNNDCVFEENTITKAKPDSLNINQKCRIFKISFNHTCICNLEWLKSITKRDIRSESYCTITDQLKYCFNTTIFNVLRYEKEVCDSSKEILSCANNRNLYKANEEFIQPKDKDHSIYDIVFIGIGSIFLLGLIIFVLQLYARKSNHHEIVMSGGDGVPGHTTVLYESREFTPDDKRIISQTLEVIRKKYNRIYDNVRDKINILLRGNITEKEKLEAIGDIIHDLESCQSPGDSFVAFTDILSRHLNPPQSATAPPPEPVYSEPIIVGNPGVEEIYAEPNQFQQREPLLSNDYSTPADRNVESNVYSEPVILGKEKVPPYAIADPKLISPYAHAPVIQQHQSPSTSETTQQNLPDVLSQAEPKPLTHVQQLAHSFANNPNFHINRSPNTNRRIPMYTIPNKVKPPTVPDSATFNLEDFGDDDDLLGATALPLDNGSNHSGGSKETIQIDDIIQYVDNYN